MAVTLLAEVPVAVTLTGEDTVALLAGELIETAPKLRAANENRNRARRLGNRPFLNGFSFFWGGDFLGLEISWFLGILVQAKEASTLLVSGFGEHGPFIGP
jgi:hypothetical protein